VNVELVPNRNVLILNNVAYNPAGFRAPMTVFRLDGPRDSAPGVTWSGPLPAASDEGVVVRGNVIWTGTSGEDFGLGAGDAGQGCQAANPTCNPAQLLADNAINTIEPQLVNPAAGDYRPAPGGNLVGRATVPLPALDVTALPEAQRALAQLVTGLSTSVSDDFNGAARAADVPGALVVGSQPAAPAPLTARMYLPIAGG
jgi:hypothetical protein